MHIGDTLKHKRVEMGFTQNQLAEKAGISKAQISRIENGEQANPQIQTIVALATALCLSVEELVFGEEAKSTGYLFNMIEKLPDEDKVIVRKLLKGWILATQSEEMNH